MARAFPSTERRTDCRQRVPMLLILCYLNMPRMWALRQYTRSQAQALNQGDLAALETTPTLLLVTVILLFQLHIRLPSVVTELR